MSGATGAWCVCACSVERDRLVQAAAADAYERGRRDVLAERDELAETLRFRSEALNRVAAELDEHRRKAETYATLRPKREREAARLRQRAIDAEAKVARALAYCDHLEEVTAEDIAIDDPEDEAYQAAESTMFVVGHFRAALVARAAPEQPR